MTSNYEILSDLVDLLVIESPIPFEPSSYEGLKEIAIMNSYEQFQSIINNQDLSQEERDQSIVAIMSYLLLENTIMHVNRLKG